MSINLLELLWNIHITGNNIMVKDINYIITNKDSWTVYVE